MHGLVVILFACLVSQTLAAFQTVEFEAFDGIDITADVYLASEDKKTPFIILFHQAGYSRGEYREIAPRLNELGYNCMAVDLRAGSGVKEVINETAEELRHTEKPEPTYLDAETDMLDAIFYARDNYATGPVILWGSSYSASLALIEAAERPRMVAGVVAFSPGEYFRDLDKPYNWVARESRTLEIPVFIASARNEERLWAVIYHGLYSEDKVAFRPEDVAGMHGSRALWPETPGNEQYWQAVTAFLKRYFPVKPTAAE